MILVTGATGTIGRFLVRDLKHQGAAFRALVRDEAKGQALGCELVVGDFSDAASIERALFGVSAVFLNGPFDDHMVAHQKAAIDAAVKAGVGRIVGLSTAGAQPHSEVSIGRLHAEIDAHLAKSGLEHTVLKPGAFTQNLLNSAHLVKSEHRIVGSYGQGKVAFIDAEDIAACAAAALTAKAPVGDSFMLFGAEAHTYDEVAAALSAKLGRTIRYHDLPAEQFVAGAKARGLPPGLADDLGVLMTWVRSGKGGATNANVQLLTGRAPRTLDQFLDANIHAFK